MYSQLVNHYNQIDLNTWTWNIELELIDDLIKITEMANQIRVGGGLPFTEANIEFHWISILAILNWKYGLIFMIHIIPNWMWWDMECLEFSKY